MYICQNCSYNGTGSNLVINNLPISNKFKKNKTNNYLSVEKITLHKCSYCLLLQIKEKIPLKLIKPKKSLHVFREPEKHLDDFIKIYKNKFKSKLNTVLGITYKDKTLVDRFKASSENTYIINPKKDLGISSKGVCTETIIPKLTQASIIKLKNKIGKVDLIVARHVIEHSYNAKKTLNILKNLLSNEGKILIEVPDCSIQLKNLDYTMIWEEHYLYFQPFTFKQFLLNNKFSINIYKKYNYPVENVQLCLIQESERKKITINKNDYNINKKIISKYLSNFNKTKKIINEFFKKQSKTKKIFIYGGGHFSVIFIHIFNLDKYIVNIIDDNKDKKNMLLPGTNLKIINSSILNSVNKSLCFLAFHPDNAKKIIKKNKTFKKNGNNFLSIFPNKNKIINYLK